MDLEFNVAVPNCINLGSCGTLTHGKELRGSPRRSVVSSGSRGVYTSRHNMAVASRMTVDQALAAHHERRYRAAFRAFGYWAAQGDASASHMLGFMYDVGQGTRRNKAKAIYWYKKAYARGESIAASKRIGEISTVLGSDIDYCVNQRACLSVDWKHSRPMGVPRPDSNASKSPGRRRTCPEMPRQISLAHYSWIKAPFFRAHLAHFTRPQTPAKSQRPTSPIDASTNACL